MEIRSPARRRRPALSCVRCRRRKIKCDRNDPCGPCVLAREQCVYKVYDDRSPASRRRQTMGMGREGYIAHDGSSFGAGTPQLSAIETDAGDEASRVRASDVARVPASSVGVGVIAAMASEQEHEDAHETTASTPARGPAGNAPLGKLLQRVQKHGESARDDTAGSDDEGADLSVARSVMRSAQMNSSADKKRTLRWTSGAEWSSEFADIITCFHKVFEARDSGAEDDREIGALIREIRMLMQQCKETARCLKLDRPSRNPSQLHFDLSAPQREVADVMVRSYFAHFESAYRILHMPSFWADYESFWAAPEAAKPAVRFEVLLVIAIGSVLCNNEQLAEPLRNRQIEWISAAQVWLSGLIEKDRLEIIGIQVHCLTLLAQQLCAVGANLPWVSTGMLVHKAMQICLHRDPKMLPAMSCLEAEIRRRLWATIMELVVQSSFDALMPPRMSLDDFDVDAPANVDDKDLLEEASSFQSQPRTTYTDTSVQLLLYDSLPTRLRIVQLLHGLGSELAYSDALTLTSEIMDTLQALANFARVHASSMTAFHRNMVDLILRRTLIPLHRPFVDNAKENPRFHYSITISLDAALAITNPDPDESFQRVLHAGVGFWRESFWYATCVISERAIGDTLQQQRDGTFGRDGGRREILKRALATLLNTSVGRLEHSDTNVKSHMFLSMVLGQIEALELVSSTESKILKAAQESLLLCSSILDQRKKDCGAMVIDAQHGGFADDYHFSNLGTGMEWEDFLEGRQFL